MTDTTDRSGQPIARYFAPGAGPRPTNPITEGNSAPCTAEFPDAPVEREPAPASRQMLTLPAQSAVTMRDASQSSGSVPVSLADDLVDAVDDVDGAGQVAVTMFWRSWLEDFRPPAVWSDPPPSVADLVAYSDDAEWTAPAGFWRGVGGYYSRIVAIPFTVVCRYLEWIVQRPGRLATVLVLYVVLAHTSLGGWMPWPTWLL